VLARVEVGRSLCRRGDRIGKLYCGFQPGTGRSASSFSSRSERSSSGGGCTASSPSLLSSESEPLDTERGRLCRDSSMVRVACELREVIVRSVRGLATKPQRLRLVRRFKAQDNENTKDSGHHVRHQGSEFGAQPNRIKPNRPAWGPGQYLDGSPLFFCCGVVLIA